MVATPRRPTPDALSAAGINRVTRLLPKPTSRCAKRAFSKAEGIIDVTFMNRAVVTVHAPRTTVRQGRLGQVHVWTWLGYSEPTSISASTLGGSRRAFNRDSLSKLLGYVSLWPAVRHLFSVTVTEPAREVSSAILGPCGRMPVACSCFEVRVQGEAERIQLSPLPYAPPHRHRAAVFRRQLFPRGPVPRDPEQAGEASAVAHARTSRSAYHSRFEEWRDVLPDVVRQQLWLGVHVKQSESTRKIRQNRHGS